MLNITTEQKTFLDEYIKNVDELIKSDNINKILIELDDVIIEFGMDKNQEITKKGVEMQKIYDQIYSQNC